MIVNQKIEVHSKVSSCYVLLDVNLQHLFYISDSEIATGWMLVVWNVAFKEYTEFGEFVAEDVGVL